MDKERRQSRRAMLLTEVKYEGAGVHAETRISDISTLGIYIDCLSPLPIGSDLMLSFTLPSGYLIESEAKVIHCQPGIGMGVAFTNLKPADARRIQRFIDLNE